MAMKHVQTILPMKIYKKLRILAIDKDTSIAKLIQFILTEYLANTPNTSKEEN